MLLTLCLVLARNMYKMEKDIKLFFLIYGVFIKDNFVNISILVFLFFSCDYSYPWAMHYRSLTGLKGAFQ